MNGLTVLNGITRAGGSPVTNPGEHFPLRMRNRVILEKHSPDGKVQRVVHEDNIMCSYGLNWLCERAASGGEASSWVQAVAIGTDASAPVSTNTTLGASTAVKAVSAASANISDAGNRTFEAQATFDDANPYTVKEVGLFGTTDASGSMVAHSTLAATDQVIKGTGDTINVSHQIVFTTA